MNQSASHSSDTVPSSLPDMPHRKDRVLYQRYWHVLFLHQVGYMALNPLLAHMNGQIHRPVYPSAL